MSGPDSIGSANLDGSSSGLISGLTGLGSVRDFALGPIPEPSTYAAILGGCALLFVLGARYRRKQS